MYEAEEFELSNSGRLTIPIPPMPSSLDIIPSADEKTDEYELMDVNEFIGITLLSYVTVWLAGGGGTWETVPSGWNGEGTAPFTSIWRMQAAGSPMNWPGNAVMAPRRTGFEFLGWSPGIQDFWPTVNTVYTAGWDAHQIRVTLAGGGGTWETVPSGWNGEGTAPYARIWRMQAAGSPMNWPGNTVMAPMRTGFEFLGWTPGIQDLWPTVNTTYTAQWEQTVSVMRISTLSFFFRTHRDPALPDDSFVYEGDEFDFIIVVRAYPGVGNVAQDVQLFKRWPEFMGVPTLLDGAYGFERVGDYIIFDLGDLAHYEEVFVVFEATAIDDDMQDNLVMRLSTVFSGIGN